MINYSIFTGEYIFSDWEDFKPLYEEYNTVEGISLMVERITPRQIRVERIISSDPAVFLRADIAPGIIINTDLQI